MAKKDFSICSGDLCQIEVPDIFPTHFVHFILLLVLVFLFIGSKNYQTLRNRRALCYVSPRCIMYELVFQETLAAPQLREPSA